MTIAARRSCSHRSWGSATPKRPRCATARSARSARGWHGPGPTSSRRQAASKPPSRASARAAGAGAEQVEAVLADDEPPGLGDLREGAAEGALEVVGDGHVLHATARGAHEVVVVLGQVLRQL